MFVRRHEMIVVAENVCGRIAIHIIASLNLGGLDKVAQVAQNLGRRNKSEVPPSLAARLILPWPPLHSLPYALKSKPICVDGLPLLSRIAIAIHLNWCLPVSRKWMRWSEDCRAAP